MIVQHVVFDVVQSFYFLLKRSNEIGTMTAPSSKNNVRNELLKWSERHEFVVSMPAVRRTELYTAIIRPAVATMVVKGVTKEEFSSYFLDAVWEEYVCANQPGVADLQRQYAEQAVELQRVLAELRALQIERDEEAEGDRKKAKKKHAKKKAADPAHEEESGTE